MVLNQFVRRCTATLVIYMMFLRSSSCSKWAGSHPSSKQYDRPHYKDNEIDYWLKHGQLKVLEAFQKPHYTGKAKNIILFIGDGMGLTVTTAGRILKGQKKGHSGEEEYLEWEKFHNTALLKTYCLDKQVGDSACTGTALMTGVKANYGTVGLSGNATYEDCEASLIEANRQKSILTWAQKAGKETGIVTTVGITNASPASLYAHSASRRWECDTKIKKALGPHPRCKDIARQLVEDEPGRNLKVIFGGGRQELGAPPLWRERKKCVRSDGRNLVEDWRDNKEDQSKTHAYVTTTQELNLLDLNNTEYIMGLFGERHTPYEVYRTKSPEGTPSLKQMTKAAINRLSKSQNGFFLMVEGGRIDHGLHDSKPRLALEELVSMDSAVAAALEMVNLEETLIIITADHSHSMTLSGYPDRGNDIFGLSQHMMVADGLPYTTLMFTSGPGWNFSWDGEKVVRPNLTTVDTGASEYVSLSTIPMKGGFELHGGEDVVAYAAGPMAHLFSGVQEQTFVAHMMGFAACVGPYSDCQHMHSKQDIDTHHHQRPHINAASKEGIREKEEYLQDLDATESPTQSFQTSSAPKLVTFNWFILIIYIFLYNNYID